MRWLAFIVAGLLATSAHAEVQVRRGQGTPAPTSPVTSNNLEAPVFQSDVRNLEAILDKDETARVIKDGAKDTPAAAAPAATKPIKTVPVQVTPANAPAEAAPQEQGIIDSSLMAVRVTAIRWRDVIDIIFTVVLMFYVRKLYLLSREQHRILSHSIRSAEYSAAAAKRAADICETLLQSQQKPDEAQHRLDI